jgi:hypothetical protein
MTTAEIHSSRLASDTDDLRKFCKKQHFPFHVIDLSQLQKFQDKAAFVHTGESENEFNKGNTNHWLFVYADLLFDSYGKYKDYDFGEHNYTFIITNPKQLQTYGTTVCGSYCAMFYYFLEKIYPKMEFEKDKENDDKSSDDDDDESSFSINKSNIGRELGEDFSEYFFSNNKTENDKTAFKWMQENS